MTHDRKFNFVSHSSVTKEYRNMEYAKCLCEKIKKHNNENILKKVNFIANNVRNLSFNIKIKSLQIVIWQLSFTHRNILN